MTMNHIIFGEIRFNGYFFLIVPFRLEVEKLHERRALCTICCSYHISYIKKSANSKDGSGCMLFRLELLRGERTCSPK